MTKALDEVNNTLLLICQKCSSHKIRNDSYTSPGFAEFLQRPLTLDDIKTETCSVKDTPPIDPSTVIWENSIKNFVSDIFAINYRAKLGTYFIFLEYGYSLPGSSIPNNLTKYDFTRNVLVQAFIEALHSKNVNKVSSIIVVQPTTEECDNFIVESVLEGDSNTFIEEVSSKDLTQVLLTFYVPNDTFILCHTVEVEAYRECISMMPDAGWSVSCFVSRFVTTYGLSKCKYVFCIFSYANSTETRAEGRGAIKLLEFRPTKGYVGRVNYYNRFIRGSRHSSGRCYDCQTLYKLLLSLGAKPTSSPVTPQHAVFEQSFLSFDSDDF